MKTTQQWLNDVGKPIGVFFPRKKHFFILQLSLAVSSPLGRVETVIFAPSTLTNLLFFFSSCLGTQVICCNYATIIEINRKERTKVKEDLSLDS